MSEAGAWRVERARGSAAEFHARAVPSPAERTVWVHEVISPALVLGSAQPDHDVDAVAAQAAGVEVVRRRSGGGAVLLVPGEAVWVDVIVPAGDRWWEADVGRSFAWLGEVWAEALGALGMTGLAVHHGPPRRTAWSDRICFAGVGSGEVTAAGGAKVVGLSQRRTRVAARFQSAVLGRFDIDVYAALLAPPRPTGAERAALAAAVAPVAAPLAAVEAAFLTALATR